MTYHQDRERESGLEKTAGNACRADSERCYTAGMAQGKSISCAGADADVVLRMTIPRAKLWNV